MNHVATRCYWKGFDDRVENSLACRNKASDQSQSLTNSKVRVTVIMVKDSYFVVPKDSTKVDLTGSKVYLEQVSLLLYLLAEQIRLFSLIRQLNARTRVVRLLSEQEVAISRHRLVRLAHMRSLLLGALRMMLSTRRSNC